MEEQRADSARHTTRLATFDGQRIETVVVRGALAPGDDLVGPAVCELPDATIVVPPHWRVQVSEDGTIALEHGQ
jgi:N-methylhydantoinase A